MTDPENFLSRWSRKKLDAADELKPPPAAPDGDGAPPPTAENVGKAPETGPAPATETPKPEFDLASLPSIDSIGAQTDIRGFLQAGVPPDLVRAALRRAWSTDPAIRDFKGLAENDWDFNDPNSMMGFGELGPEFDVKRMLASVFGETPKEESGSVAAQSDDADSDPAKSIDATRTAGEIDASGSSNESPADAAGGSATAGGDAVAPALADNKIVQRSIDIAAQDIDSDDAAAEADMPVRSHGGALPR
jgi:hypothetical protein